MAPSPSKCHVGLAASALDNAASPRCATVAAAPIDVATETDAAGRTLRSWIVTARVAGSAANVPFVEMRTVMSPVAKSCVYAHVVHACWSTR